MFEMRAGRALDVAPVRPEFAHIDVANGIQPGKSAQLMNLIQIRDLVPHEILIIEANSSLSGQR